MPNLPRNLNGRLRHRENILSSLQPDLTLAEVQRKLLGETRVQLSLPQVWHLLRKLGLRLKKSYRFLTSG